MRYFLQLSVVLLVATSAYLMAQTTSMAKPLPADVRVLIDVSGSMKKTDPQNLRKPAMELLVQLMPEGTKAGVWTFGQSVNMLVAHRPVDDAWGKDAAAKTSGINSVALFTHIGKALEQAAYDSEQPGTDYRNNIILLTDGVVDIDKEVDVNLRERERILTDLLPRLKASGYVIHTIALSDAADQELMQALSLATDGVFAVADTADELMSAFLRIFDQAVPAERLPLENNSFLVDDSVKEFTALIFRKQGAAPTVLISPTGTQYNAPAPDGGVSWYNTEKYDLITVQQPAAGEWQVKADFDSDNRVTVVSDLQLQIASLHNNLLVGQPLDLHFFFQEDSVKVTKLEFLRLLDINAFVTRTSDNKNWQIPLSESRPPIDGVYHKSLDVFQEADDYAIRIVTDGKTFKREFKHHVAVMSPFTVSMTKAVDEQRVRYTLDVLPDPQLINIAQTGISATIKNSVGTSETQALVLTEQRGWKLVVTPTTAADYSVEMEVKGTRMNGVAFKETLPVHYFSYPEKDDPIVDSPVIPPVAIEPEVPEPVIIEEAPTPEPELEVVPPAPAEEVSKWIVYGSVALANLLVFGLAFFAYRLMSGKKAKDELEELEKTLEAEPDESSIKNKPTMQEVEPAPVNTIDVSTDNATAHIAMDDSKKSTAADDELLLDLDDLDDNPDESNKDKH